MRRSFVLAAFVVPLVLLFCAFPVVRRYGEPYPFLMMPGFGGTLTEQDGLIHVPALEIHARFADGSTQEVPLSRLLADAPASHHSDIAEFMFRASDPGDWPQSPAPRSTLKAWMITHLAPIRDRLASRDRAGNPPDGQTRAWLARRLGELLPERTSVRVDFDWYDESYRPTAGGMPVLARRVLDQRYIVPTGDERVVTD